MPLSLDILHGLNFNLNFIGLLFEAEIIKNPKYATEDKISNNFFEILKQCPQSSSIGYTSSN
jgi:hypothetical protein